MYYYYLAVPTGSKSFPVQVVQSFESRDALMDYLGKSDPEDQAFNNYYICIVVLSKRIATGKYVPISVIQRKSLPLPQLLTNGKGDYPPAVLEFGEKLKNFWATSF